MIWELSNYPMSMESGHIIPIYKSGSKDQVKSCRQVTLTFHMMKIFETVVKKKKKVQYLEQEKINSGQQSWKG